MVRGRALAEKVVKDCQFCKVRNEKTVSQQIGALPKEKVASAVGSLDSLAYEGLGHLTAELPALKEAIVEVVDTNKEIKDAVEVVVKEIEDDVEKVVNKIKDVIEEIVEEIEDVTEEVADTIEDVVGMVTDTIENVVEKIADKI